MKKKIILGSGLIVLIFLLNCQYQQNTMLIDLIDYYFQAFPEPFSQAEHPSSWRQQQITLRNTARKAVLYTQPGEVDIYLYCPKQAQLRFWLGIGPRNDSRHALPKSTVPFSISISTDEMAFAFQFQPEVVVSTLLQSWYPCYINLSHFAGQIIKISFCWQPERNKQPYQLALGSIELWGSRGADAGKEFSMEPGQEVGPKSLQRAGDNLVMIIIDAVRGDKMGFLGNSQLKTPWLDWLAKRGITFSNTLSSSSWTKPAVATLFTGHYPEFHGAITHLNKLSNKIPTLAELFQARGYQTIGLSSNPNISAPFGFERGFTEFVFHHDDYSQSHDAQLAQRASEMLREHCDQPFFLYIHFVDPHYPYHPEIPVLYSLDTTQIEERLQLAYSSFEPPRDTVSRVRELIVKEALYDTEITSTDARVGDLLLVMNGLDILKNSTIVFLSDHGEEFFEHGVIGHGKNLYQTTIHVPFVIAPSRWFGSARLEEGLVRYVDLFPTLVDLFELPAQSEVRYGSSLLPGLVQNHTHRSEPGLTPDYYLHLNIFKTSSSALIMDNFKLVKKDDDPLQLFSFVPTLDERNNLALQMPVRLGYYDYLMKKFSRQLLKNRTYLLDNNHAETEQASTETTVIPPGLEENLRALGYLE